MVFSRPSLLALSARWHFGGAVIAGWLAWFVDRPRIVA
jgi:hypothetical protein